MTAPVVVAGAGPVGLALAVGLAHHGVRSVVLEERARLSEHSKAPRILSRTLEIFAAWGIVDRFLERGFLLSRPQLWVPGREKPLLTSPAGGQGMNGGIQDAHNLAWKLARALAGGREEAALLCFDDLCFDDGRLPGWDVEDLRARLRDVPGLAVVRVARAEAAARPGDVVDVEGAVWRQWRPDLGTAALVRPDTHVGWMAPRPTLHALAAGVRRAVGLP